MEPIQVVGIGLLDEQEKSIANKLVNEYYQKISRELKNTVSVTIHIKTHTKGGKRKKFDVRVKVSAPTRIFESQESDWDLARTLHKVFKNMERQIKHRLHSD